VPSKQEQNFMTTQPSEKIQLCDEVLDQVSGGRYNLANLPGFRSTTMQLNDSPLYGVGSMKDTIDNNPNLPN
jgi:hypothetical protein